MSDWGWDAAPWVRAVGDFDPAGLTFSITERKFSRGAPGPQIVKREVCGIQGDLVPPGHVAQLGVTPPAFWTVARMIIEVRQERRLRPYQAVALEALLSTWRGILLAPCGAGKTVIGVALLARLQRDALILVHTLDLKAQWERELELVFGPDHPHRVETFQSLAKKPGPIDAGVLLVDEGHHTPAATFLDVVQRVRCFRAYGLTATPDRDDGMTPIMHWWLGPIVHEITHEDCGALRPKIYPLLTDWDWMPAEGEALDHTQMISDMLTSEDRNWWITHTIGRRDSRFGGTHLIITTRKAHVIELARLIHLALEEKVAALTSKLTGKRRQEILDRVRSGELRFLVATQLADEGLDVPIIDTVWLVSPTKSKGRTIQRVGRALRKLPGKNDPVVFDLVDRKISSLYRQWRQRVHAMKRVGDVQKPINLEQAVTR